MALANDYEKNQLIFGKLLEKLCEKNILIKENPCFFGDFFLVFCEFFLTNTLTVYTKKGKIVR